MLVLGPFRTVGEAVRLAPKCQRGARVRVTARRVVAESVAVADRRRVAFDRVIVRAAQ